MLIRKSTHLLKGLASASFKTATMRIPQVTPLFTALIAARTFWPLASTMETIRRRLVWQLALQSQGHRNGDSPSLLINTVSAYRYVTQLLLLEGPLRISTTIKLIANALRNAHQHNHTPGPSIELAMPTALPTAQVPSSTSSTLIWLASAFARTSLKDLM